MDADHLTDADFAGAGAQLAGSVEALLSMSRELEPDELTARLRAAYDRYMRSTGQAAA